MTDQLAAIRELRELNAKRTPGQIDGKTHWEFCCGWYTPDDIERSIARSIANSVSMYPDAIHSARPPADVGSREFAEWMTDQYRLAMRKGMELASRETAALANACDWLLDAAERASLVQECYEECLQRIHRDAIKLTTIRAERDAAVAERDALFAKLCNWIPVEAAIEIQEQARPAQEETK